MLSNEYRHGISDTMSHKTRGYLPAPQGIQKTIIHHRLLNKGAVYNIQKKWDRRQDFTRTSNNFPRDEGSFLHDKRTADRYGIILRNSAGYGRAWKRINAVEV